MRRASTTILLAVLAAVVPAVCLRAQPGEQDMAGERDSTAAADSLPDVAEAGDDTTGYDAQFDSIPPITGNQTLEIRVSPVDIDRGKPEQPAMHYYDRHGNQLETPVRFLAELDTVTSVKSGPRYPAYNGVSFGVNIFDPIMMIFGQRRLSVDLSAEVSIFNWFFPLVEMGVAYAGAHPEDGRSHITMSPTFYGKLGFNYNFLYKSNPDYQVYLGFRAGLSKFHFSASDLQAGSQYYGVADGRSLWGVGCTAWYGQALAGVRVKIYRCFSMGWSVRYGFRFKTTTTREGVEPWFIPGYGTNPLTATYSLIFTF